MSLHLARILACVALGLIGAWCAPAYTQAARDAESTLRDIVSLQSVAADAATERKYGIAIDAESRALELAQLLGRPRLTAVLLARLGQFYEDDNRSQRALVANELALKALGEDPSLNLGDVLQRLGSGGKLPFARPATVSPDLYRESVARELEVEQDDPTLPIKLLINIGNGYLRQPQDAAALRAYQLALRHPEIERAPLLKGHALANSGEILRRQGNADEAQSSLVSAIALIEQHGKREDTRRALTSLARIAFDRSDMAEARKLYASAIALYVAAGDARGESRAQLGVGYLELSQRRVQPATLAYRRAVEIAHALNDKEALWQGEWGLGRCLQIEGRLDEAAAAFASSLEIIGDREDDLATDEGKVALIQQARDAFDELVSVHLERAKRDPARYADALAVAEESRGRALHRLMRGWSAGARPSPSSLGLSACYTPPRPAIATPCTPSNLRRNLANQSVMGTPSGPPECESSIGRSPMAQMTIGTPTSIEPPSVVPLIPEGAPNQLARGTPTVADAPVSPGAPPPAIVDASPLARLVFHVLRDRTAVFVVARDGTVRGHVVPAGADAVAKRVQALRRALDVDRAIRGVARGGSEDTPPTGGNDEPALLRMFFREFIAPVADALPPAGAVIAIEPHGPLWLVPFAALLDGNDAWFGDRYELVYAPSAAALAELRRIPALAQRSEVRALVVGNPVVSSRPAAADDPFRGSFEALPGAEEEAKRVSAFFAADRTTLLLGARADLESIERESRNDAILHFATHGFANTERPLDSFVLLASSQCEDRLSAKRIMTLPLAADLVTLSACQTGVGSISGEGVIGLSRAFLVAGARSVLVSLWSVDDEATEALMVAFYERYVRDGMTKTKALASAMRTVRESPGHASARYWAPFILVGADT